MFYTSYFGNVRNLPKDAILVSISLWSPKDWKGKHIKQLAPTEDILMEYKRTGKQVRYVQRYSKEILAKRSADGLVKAIREKWGEQDVIFLCYEKSGFCHRHLLANWLTMYGYPCEEWGES